MLKPFVLDTDRCQWIDGEGDQRQQCRCQRVHYSFEGREGQRSPWCEEHLHRVYQDGTGLDARVRQKLGSAYSRIDKNAIAIRNWVDYRRVQNAKSQGGRSRIFLPSV